MRAGLTMRALGDLAGVSHVTVHRIEVGTRYGNDSLPKLAEALGCDPLTLGWIAA